MTAKAYPSDRRGAPMTETQAQPSSLDVDSPESKLWTELLSATQRLEERDAELAATKAALAEAERYANAFRALSELSAREFSVPADNLTIPLAIELGEAESRIAELEAALTDTRRELWHCARQLDHLGRRSHPESSVSKALARADAALTAKATGGKK